MKLIVFTIKYSFCRPSEERYSFSETRVFVQVENYEKAWTTVLDYVDASKDSGTLRQLKRFLQKQALEPGYSVKIDEYELKPGVMAIQRGFEFSTL